MMYSSRIFLYLVTAVAVISGTISHEDGNSLRKLEGHVTTDEDVTIDESPVDVFFDEMKELVKQLLGMGDDPVAEAVSEVEEKVEEAVEEEENGEVEEEEDEVNPCEGKKPSSVAYFDNQACVVDSIVAVLEQAGANVTKGYYGEMDVSGREPITESYSDVGLCPVNVHWHLGAEHLSVGEYDENGKGPGDDHRTLAEDARLGFRCHYYDENDPKFTTEYDWQYCEGMHVGETYEVHWPHSAAGACGTKWQYQTPFYDGVFCTDGIVSLDPLNTYEMIGVQGQIFTIINDEDYYRDGLINGMVVDGDFGADITAYTGSTTGTTRDNVVCSKYTPITWQVDRNCHLVSASSFDKMCKDMMEQADDMSGDLYAHGARELVDDYLAANNQVEGP